MRTVILVVACCVLGACAGPKGPDGEPQPLVSFSQLGVGIEVSLSTDYIPPVGAEVDMPLKLKFDGCSMLSGSMAGGLNTLLGYAGFDGCGAAD